jgi:ribosomal protein L3
MMAELKELVGMTPKLSAGAKYEKAIAQPLEELAGTRQEKAEFDVTQKEDVTRREAERGKKKAEVSRAEVQEIKASPEFTGLRKLEEETMDKAFIPTKDTAVDIASLYSLVNVIGMSIGTGGKQNAMQAMHAMNGMLEGYQKGRADLYKREKDIFDTSMKTLKTKTDILQRRLKEIADLASKNAAAADQEADVLFAEQGADFLKKYKEKFGLPATVKFWEDVVKAKGEATKLTLREEETARKEAANERRHRETIAAQAARERLRMSHQEKARELKAVAKPASATNERYANTVYRASNEVLRSLELVEQIGISTGGGALGTVVGKGTIPSEVQRYIGQLMTEEQQRNYNTAMSGIALELAYVLGGGYKPDVTTVSKLETLLSVGPNDTPANAAYKFADVTAKLKAAIEVSPAYTEDQKRTKEMITAKMDRYASPEEVFNRVYGNAGRTEEPVVRSGKVYEPQTDADFSSVPGGELYKDPADGKIYRKRK